MFTYICLFIYIYMNLYMNLYINTNIDRYRYIDIHIYHPLRAAWSNAARFVPVILHQRCAPV